MGPPAAPATFSRLYGCKPALRCVVIVAAIVTVAAAVYDDAQVAQIIRAARKDPTLSEAAIMESFAQSPASASVPEVLKEAETEDELALSFAGDTPLEAAIATALTGCTDTPTSWMVNNGKTCSVGGSWLATNKCKHDSAWVTNKYCQKSCFDNGAGYDADDCSTAAPTTSGPSDNAPELEFKGCFKDSNQRDLPVNQGGPKEIQECADACTGYRYFGRQWAKTCWCGDSYGSQGETTGCNCDENASNMGGWKNCVYEAYSPDDPLHFNPAQSDPASPLSNATSICRGWYISDGPVKHGSNKAAADALKSAADGTWTKGTFERRGSPPTDPGGDHYGTGWAVGFKHGCTTVTNNGGAVFTICGCYEIWCPVRWNILSHPDDIYGRNASGVDGSMAVRNTCYSARAVFGCYSKGRQGSHSNWINNCGHKKEGSYQPGAGTTSGTFAKIWEQLAF